MWAHETNISVTTFKRQSLKRPLGQNKIYQHIINSGPTQKGEEKKKIQCLNKYQKCSQIRRKICTNPECPLNLN